MKESSFIDEHSEDWQKLETNLLQKKTEESELGDLFLRITDDLAYAQTKYPRRSVKLYLNNLTSKLYKELHRNERKELNIRGFFLQTIPADLHQARLAIRIALVVFITSCIIGAFSLHEDADFAYEILGNGYMDMTQENIEKGDPMAVYKDRDAFDMFISIAINNILVASYAFILGLFAGLGSFSILVSNGIMLGVFQYFFFQNGLGITSMLTIWQHGTVEITSIVISGGLGLEVARGMLFPGTLKRSQSLRMAFMRSVRIWIVLFPFFVFAAFIEGFFTRHDFLPPIIRGLFILLNLAFVVWYFVLLPFKSKVGTKAIKEDYEAAKKPFEINHIRSVGNELMESIKAFLNKSSTTLSVLIASIVLFCIGYYVVVDQLLVEDLRSEAYITMLGIQNFTILLSQSLNNMFLLIGYFIHDSSSKLALSIFSSFIGLSGLLSLLNIARLKDTQLSNSFKISVFLSFSLLTYLTSLGGVLFFLIGIVFLFPIVSQSLVFRLEGNSIGKAISNGFEYYFKSFARIVLLTGLNFAFCLIIFSLINAPSAFFIMDFLQTFIGLSSSNGTMIWNNLNVILVIFSYSISMVIYFMSLMLNTYSSLEKSNASDLIAKIQSVQPKKKFYAKG